MKLVTTSLLLLVAGCGLFQATSAGVSQVPLDLLKQLKIQDDKPEVPLLVEEEEVFETNEWLESSVEVEGRASNDGCVISIRGGLTDPQPVFLKTDEDEFYPYSETGNMEIPTGQSLQMLCPEKFKSFTTTLITATCVSGNMFRVQGTTYRFQELVCKSWPDFVVRKTDSSCNGGNLLEVGFEISPTRFVPEMEICFNEEEEVTRYVYHKLHPGSNFYQTGVQRINFQTSGFFEGKNVDRLYTQKSQIQVIDNELGGVAHKYFDTTKNVYLARGHLGAKADLMYGTQQRATFLFVNAAPQWQVFNAGNWVRVEDGVRSWVSKNKLTVECYTGVWGVTTLPNNRGQETPLYLAHDNNKNGLIPVPKLYFRVVIEPETEKGIVFIGVNNPHLTLQQIEEDYIICNDISDKVNYIKWKRTDITAGYSYACTVEDFINVVEDLPELSADGGLLI